MNACEKCRKAIQRGELARVLSHTKECDSCASFAEAFGFMGKVQSETLGEDELDAILGGVRTQLRAQTRFRRNTAEMSSVQRCLGVTMLALAIAVGVFLTVRRADLGVYPPLRGLLELSVLGAIVFAYAWLLIRPLHKPPLKKTRVALQIICTLGALALPLALPLAHQHHPASLAGVGDDLLRRAGACFVWGSLLGGAWASVAFLFTQGARGVRFAPVSLWIGSAMFAQFVLHLHCPIVHPLHIGLGHTSILAGAAFAIFVLSPMRRR